MTSFSLRSLRLRPGEEHREPKEIALEPISLGGQRYLPVPDKVQAELAVSRAQSGTVFELRYKTRLHGPCYRCLADAVREHGIQVSPPFGIPRFDLLLKRR